MKILHLISQRPEMTGSGVYLQNIIKHAQKKGHRNYLLAGIPLGKIPQLTCIGRESCSFVTFSGGDLGFSIPGMSDVMPYASSSFRDLSESQISNYEKRFEEELREASEIFQPDVVHSHHLWLATATAKRTLPQIPLVTSCHSTDLRQLLICPHLKERVVEDCRKVERVLSLSGDQAHQIRKLYGIADNCIDVVGGGFDDKLFSWNPGILVPPVQILYGGKLSYAKGVDWLLRSLVQLEKLPFHLHLAGSGSGEEEKVCLALAEALKEKVTVYGRISQQKLASLMGQCHLFILPSFFEGLPLVLLEAMASGCRIIATDLPGCLELLGEGDSDLVEWVSLPEMDEVDQPKIEDRERLDFLLAQAITRMIKRIMSNSSPGKDVVEKIVHPYGWESVFGRINATYEKVIAHK